MSGKARRSARIPADRRPSQGDAAIGRPWFGPERLGDRPWILTFVGTDESFVDSFFRGIRESGGGYAPGVFPKLLPVRDYAEPPRQVVDGSGAPLYERSLIEPAEWPGEGEAELDGQASFADVLREAVSDPDPLPPAGDSSRPSWLRKLYLPMHVHFHVVACDLVCSRPGAPRIDPKRVIEAGMVVRRFIPERMGERARWEDWIPSPFGNGIWAEIADENMKILGDDGKPTSQTLDPKDLVFGRDEVGIRQRLGLGPNPTAKLALTTTALASVPVGVGEGNKHTARWGFLPVSSPDKERELPEPGDDVEAIKKALSDRAKAHLQERIVLPAAAIRSRIRAALLPLLAELQGALPPRPDAVLLANSIKSIQALIPVPPNAPPQPPAADIHALAKSVAAVLFPGYADNVVQTPSDALSMVLTELKNKGTPAGPPAWLTLLGGVDKPAFSTILVEELHRFCDAARAADTPGYSVDDSVLVSLLLWVRRLRAALLKKFYTSAFPSPATPPNTELAPAPEKALGSQEPMSVGPLGAELDAWLAADAAREDEPVPWPKPAYTAAEHKVHDLAITLERVLAEVDAQGAGAGGAYAAVLLAKAKAKIIGLSAAFGPPVTRHHGINLFAQPESGLLVFPGPAPTETSLVATQTQIVQKYASGSTSDELRVEGKTLRQVVRPRYDADSLYAVWCYARVAGKDHCEEPELVWGRRTEAFFLAEPMDLLGLKPVAMRLPDLPKLIRDIPRMKKARALPFAAVTTPQDSGIKTGEDPKDTAREWGIAWICSFGIPVFTICAWVMFSIILSILLLIPGFAWLLLLKFCIPVPTSKKA